MAGLLSWLGSAADAILPGDQSSWHKPTPAPVQTSQKAPVAPPRAVQAINRATGFQPPQAMQKPFVMPIKPPTVQQPQQQAKQPSIIDQLVHNLSNAANVIPGVQQAKQIANQPVIKATSNAIPGPLLNGATNLIKTAIPAVSFATGGKIEAVNKMINETIDNNTKRTAVGDVIYGTDGGKLSLKEAEDLKAKAYKQLSGKNLIDSSTNITQNITKNAQANQDKLAQTHPTATKIGGVAGGLIGSSIIPALAAAAMPEVKAAEGASAGTKLLYGAANNFLNQGAFGAVSGLTSGMSGKDSLIQGAKYGAASVPGELTSLIPGLGVAGTLARGAASAATGYATAPLVGMDRGTNAALGAVSGLIGAPVSAKQAAVEVKQGAQKTSEALKLPEYMADQSGHIAVPGSKGPKEYKTIHAGGEVKTVKGTPVPLVDGVETFIHPGNGGFVVSEASTGRVVGSAATKDLAVSSAKANIQGVGEAEFKQMLQDNQLPTVGAKPQLPPKIAPTSTVPKPPTSVKGAKPFTQEVQDTLTKAANNIGSTSKPKGAVDEITNLFNPVKGADGKIIKNDLRASVGSLELQKGQIGNATKDDVKFWDKQKPAENLAFIQKIESGAKQATPELEAQAKSFRNWFDKDYELAKTLKADTPYRQDYFAHSGIWDNPKQADQFYNKWTKETLGGKPGALEERTFPTIYDGIKAGLGIKEANPQVIANANRAALLRAKMAQDFVESEGAKGLAPQEIQSVLDRYLGRGFKDSSVYQSARSVGNTLNQAQLALSAFHAGGTAINSVLSQFSNGLNDTLRMHPLRGLSEIGSAPFAPLKDVLQGGRIIKDFKAGNITDDIKNIAEGGGRIGNDVSYKATGLAQSLKDIQSGTVKGFAKGVTAAPLRALSDTAKPIMEWWVPRLKLGATKDLIDSKVLALGSNASEDAIRAAKAEAIDSIDNRFGQLIKDNIFWDQKIKDSMQILMRSPGWNIGTVREVGGGAANLLKPSTYTNLAKGKGLPENSSYALSLAAGTMLMGGTLQFIHTGEWPTTAKDYFYPKTGQTDKNGNPERVALPTYAKDVFSFVHNPTQTAANKANPFISEVLQLGKNKDYFGNDIRNPEDSLGDQAKQVGGYLAKSNLPFTVTNSGQRVDQNPSAKVETALGVSPAPGYITKSKFEQSVGTGLTAALGSKSLTPEDQALIAAKAKAKQSYKGGDESLIKGLVDSGKITQKQADNLKTSSTQNSLQNSFGYLVKADRVAAAKAISNATPDEIAHLGDTSALQKTLSASVTDDKAAPDSIAAAKQILSKLGVTDESKINDLSNQKAAESKSSRSKSTNPKDAYTKALDQYNKDKKDGKVSDVNDGKRQKELAGLKVKSSFSQDTVDLYGQPFKDIISFVNSNKNGKALWEQVKALDKANVDAGHTSKLYNKNGSLKATVAKAKGTGRKKGSGKGRKGTSTKLKLPNYAKLNSAANASAKKLLTSSSASFKVPKVAKGKAPKKAKAKTA